MITTPRSQRLDHRTRPPHLGRRAFAITLTALTVGLVGIDVLPAAPARVVGGTVVAAQGAPRSSHPTPKASRSEQSNKVQVRHKVLTGDAADIQAEADRLAAQFLWPTLGRVGVGFGLRPHPMTGKVTLHNGVDIGAPCGQAVVAPVAGRVIHAGYAKDAGYFIRIDHGVLKGRAVYTTYLHLSAFLVSVGQPVTRGQVVARVGSTGETTGCHLHFSVVQDGRVVDPMTYLLTSPGR